MSRAMRTAVGNLPFDMVEADLHKVLSSVGPVKSLR
jgi:RNA recognition motif. (a.k.a. RRM, RBD, or RNP domain)